MSLRIIVVDDEELIRRGIALILGSDAGIEIVGEAANGREAVRLVQTLQPDIVLMDVRMPVLNGIEATRRIRSTAQAPTVVVLTAFDTEDFVIEAISAGATGFLLKTTPPAQLIAAVLDAAGGNAPMDPSVLARLARNSAAGNRRKDGDLSGVVPAEHNERDTACATLAQLSDRELEVARLITRGLSNSEIQSRLYVSLPTVKTHVTHIFEKLGVDNRVRVAVLVLQAEC